MPLRATTIAISRIAPAPATAATSIGAVPRSDASPMSRAAAATMTSANAATRTNADG